MLSSPFLADHKEEASKWAGDLQSAEEIMHHWVTAQTNVSKLTRKDYSHPAISTSINVADNRFLPDTPQYTHRAKITKKLLDLIKSSLI